MTTALVRKAVVALAFCARWPTPEAGAQEFTQQTLLVAPLHTAGGFRTARQIAANLRTRLSRSANRRDLRVLDTDTVESILENSGYKVDSTLTEVEAHLLARQLRADEVVMGNVTSRAGIIEVRAEMAITRDWRLRQPLPLVRGVTAAAVADTLAREVTRARAQMVGLRRCENAGRRVEPAAAAKAAEEAVALYPASTLARTCLAIVLRFHDVAADSVAKVTGDILSLDSTNIVAAVLRARALASDNAPGTADAWAHVLRLRPDSLDLAVVGVEELLRLQQPARALAVTRTLIDLHHADVRLRRLAFRAEVSLSSWKEAALLGDSLDAEDREFRDDSTYAIRHVEALRLSGDTLGAVARSARSVKQHPGDLPLYIQYVKLVNGENGSAVPRGLAMFPSASELHVLAARAAISGGKRRDAISALTAAVTADTLLTQGYLQIAELWFDEQQPDSAVAAIVRTPRTGVNAELLRTYAIARGRQMIRGIPDTAFVIWQRALTLFSLADSVDSRDDSRSLISASTLQLSRGSLVVATKSHDCRDATRADEALERTASAIAKGVGDGSSATELRDAYGAMRSVADNALKLYCPGGRMP